MSKKRKKKSTIPPEILKSILKYIKINSAYIDNNVLAYKTDRERQNVCVKKLLTFVKKYNIQPFISFITISEIRPLFIGKISKINPDLKRKIIEASEEFRPAIIDEKATYRLLRENKTFFNFLTRMKVSDADAAHFTVAVFSNINLFISFNKRIFKDKKRKIQNELMKYNRRMPEVWNIEDIEIIIEKLKEINFI